MNSKILIEFFINVMSMGSLYALIALGLVFVFGICQLINFAYGEFITVSGYILYFVGTFTSLPWPVVYLIAILVGVAVGFISELVAFRPFRGRSLDALLVTRLRSVSFCRICFRSELARVLNLYRYLPFWLKMSICSA